MLDGSLLNVGVIEDPGADCSKEGLVLAEILEVTDDAGVREAVMVLTLVNAGVFVYEN